MAESIPSVSLGQWIALHGGVRAHIFSINPDQSLEVGYLQSGAKAIRETVVWDGSGWRFKYQGACGSYLRGAEAAIVERGPYG
jgi:hypothetical protein